MAARGVTGVCLTPHLNASRADRGIPHMYDDAFHQLAPAAPATIALSRGVELMLDAPFPKAAAEDRALRLGGSRYVLVEFPTFIPPVGARNALRQITDLGMIPLVAHPERYANCSTAVLADWRNTGARVQVDATTAFMPGGRGRRAREFLAAGLADVLAADNHGDGRTVASAFGALCEQGDTAAADLLVRGNPGAVLADRGTDPVPPVRIRQSWLEKVREWFHLEEG